MSKLDWGVLLSTIVFIVGYGIWRTRGSRTVKSFLKANNTEPWWAISLSIMATQASAITFLSTPGQAYEDGMRFIQFYFGLPIAMVILSITAVPLYYKLKVYTAYQYLESRFDLKTRSLAAGLFLLQRGLSTGLTIYAPAIILSSILGWSVTWTTVIIGLLVTLYTVSGGTRAVSETQKLQMAVMMGGMFAAAFMVVHLLPESVGFGKAVQVAGKMGKMNVVDFSFQIKDRYNFWSGITGGLFLALSYFGTDQSQVARYLGGASITQSRLGLLFNGLLKIPMQFLILMVGVLVFVFFQFHEPPVFFNRLEKEKMSQGVHATQYKQLETEHKEAFSAQQAAMLELSEALDTDNKAQIDQATSKAQKSQEHTKLVRGKVKELLQKTDPDAEAKDTDYVFLTFITTYLPHGLVGFLLAMVLCAAMGSTASALNALASTSLIDIYQRSVHTTGSEQHYLRATRLLTVFWGLLSIAFALLAARLDNLIQAVNILGSLFYGTILGIFLAAFYIKPLRSGPVFIAAICAQTLVLLMYWFTEISYLWYNVIGCALVIGIGLIIQPFYKQQNLNTNS